MANRGAEFQFGEREVEANVEPVEPPKEAGKSENLFWLGYNLMWTVDVLLRGAPGERIVHGLKQTSRHYDELGAPDGEVKLFLEQLIEKAENTLPKAWDTKARTVFIQDLGAVRRIRDPGELSPSRFDHRARHC